MKKYLFQFAFCAFASFSFIGGSCTKPVDPSATAILPIDSIGGGDDNIPRLHRLHTSALNAGRISGSMVLIPVFDSTYTNDTGGVMHITSGFIDLYGDTAFVSDSFFIDTAEVSKAEWFAVMGDITDTMPLNHPKSRISWYDAVRYCIRRTSAEALSQVYDTTNWNPELGVGPLVNWAATGYRLPTEDEWEYAARGGGRNREYPSASGTLMPSYLNYGIINYMDTALLRFDYSESYPLFGAFIDVRFTRAGYSYFSRFRNYSGTPDSFDMSGTTIPYTSPNLPKNGYILNLRFPVFADTTQLLDTNHLLRRDTVNFIVNRILPSAQNGEDRYRLNERKFLYIYTKQPYGVLDTLVIHTRQIDSLYEGETEWDIFPETIVSNAVAVMSNTAISVTDTVVRKTDSVIINRIRTYLPFTYDSSCFIRSRTVETTLYETSPFALYGFTDRSAHQPNVFRLRDMGGNVSEWCHDGYLGDRRGYRINHRTDNSTSTRVHRGGNCVSNDITEPSFNLNNGSRRSKNPYLRDGLIGLRTVKRAM